MMILSADRGHELLWELELKSAHYCCPGNAMMPRLGLWSSRGRSEVDVYYCAQSPARRHQVCSASFHCVAVPLCVLLFRTRTQTRFSPEVSCEMSLESSRPRFFPCCARVGYKQPRASFLPLSNKFEHAVFPAKACPTATTRLQNDAQRHREDEKNLAQALERRQRLSNDFPFHRRRYEQGYSWLRPRQRRHRFLAFCSASAHRICLRLRSRGELLPLVHALELAFDA